ncbi:MAG TPA: caspase family protein [Spirochaetales bacterium]|nr:caspase family protein [Spirochaetales bacterium]
MIGHTRRIGLFRMLFRGSRFFLVICLPLLLFSGCSPEVDIGERFALVYGVANYVEEVNRLQFSDDDAQDIGALLCSRGYPENHVKIRIDSQATKTQLQEDINELSQRAGKDSLFVFYFSGHGLQLSSIEVSGEYIFLYDPVNTYVEGRIKDDELMQLISRIPSRRKVVLLDSCNSGGFIGDFPGVEAIPEDYTGKKEDYLAAAQEAFVKYFANVDKGDIPYTEAVVLAAAGAPEDSYESTDMEHGVFTYFLLKTPRKADKNDDGWITTLEAYSYTRREIQDHFNSSVPSEDKFLPRISGGPLDIVLFESD